MKTEHCEYNQNGFIYNALTKLCYGSLDCVTFVSNGVKQGVVKKIGDNEHYVVHYLGVSKSEIKNYKLRAELGIKPDEYVVTSIGFDIDVKGFDLLVQAASYLTDKQFRFKIIIVGLGEEEDCKLQRILQHYKMEDRVLSVGIRNDVDDFLYFTDIYVQPSRTEAISLSIMEALLYGIPIVGTNVGGIPEVCISGQNGYLFEKGDSIGLANALFRLLEDERLRNSFGKNSLALSEKYNREKNARKLKDIYDCLLRAR